MRKILIDTLTDDDITTVAERGIFSFLSKNATDNPEYLSGDMSGLNWAYYFNHSGHKYISPLVSSILKDDTYLSDTKSDDLAKLILKICRPNWDKVYKALTIDYSPIENVDGYLSETTERTGTSNGTSNLTDSGTDNHLHTGTDTETNNGTDKHALSGTDTENLKGTDKDTKKDTISTNDTINEDIYHHRYEQHVEDNPNGKSTTHNKTYGFNSDSGSDDSESVVTVNQKITTLDRTLSVKTDGDGNVIKGDDGEPIKMPSKNSDQTERKETHKTTDDITDTLEKDDTTTTNYGKVDTETIDITKATTYNSNDNETINISHTGNNSTDTSGNEKHELHRHGNIGVTTNQQMINEELELRKHFFYETVFADLDKYLTLSIY